MRNLTPHRRFRGVSNYKASFRPYYRRPWPSDLPPQCTICGTAFLPGFNLDIGPSKAGRVFKNAAFYGIMPCLFGAVIVPYILSLVFEDFDTTTGGFIAVGIILMPGILAFLSVLMPIRRRVECKKCGWEQYFKMTPLQDLAQLSTRDD